MLVTVIFDYSKQMFAPYAWHTLSHHPLYIFYAVRRWILIVTKSHLAQNLPAAALAAGIKTDPNYHNSSLTPQKNY